MFAIILPFSVTQGRQATILKYGVRGQEVIKLQNRLRTEGFFKFHTSTGYFGPITRLAVINYQEAHNLSTDGIAGPKVIAALREIPEKEIVAKTEQKKSESNSIATNNRETLNQVSNHKEQIYVRLTRYNRGEKNDGDTNEGKTCTQLRVRGEHRGQIGIAAAPSFIPLGSLITLVKQGIPHLFLVVDRGSAVESGKAAEEFAILKGYGKNSREYLAPVIDIYSTQTTGNEYESVSVRKYVGKKPFIKLNKKEQECFLELDTWGLLLPHYN